MVKEIFIVSFYIAGQLGHHRVAFKDQKAAQRYVERTVSRVQGAEEISTWTCGDDRDDLIWYTKDGGWCGKHVPRKWSYGREYYKFTVTPKL